MRFHFVCLLTVLLGMGVYPAATGAAASRGPAVDPVCLRPETWNSGDTPVLNPAEIAAFNRGIIAAMPGTVYDLSLYPPALDAITLRTLLDAVAFPNGAYYRASSQPADAAYKDLLTARMGRDRIASANSVRYGVTVRRANLRTLPTPEGLFGNSSDREFDVLQETVFDPGEPVAILHTSTDGMFYFVQTRHYRGWLAVRDVAFAADRIAWSKWVQPKAFFVVTGARYKVNGESEVFVYQMGAKIPLQDAGKTAVLPVRAANGTLIEKSILLMPSGDLHRGFLPYTRETIVRQAFRMLGDPYGWGGLKESVDCSSFIDNVYRTVGLVLPRNADEQELVPGRSMRLDGRSSEQRNAALRGLAPGATLYMDGHVMLYLGQYRGVPYAIHSLGSHTVNGQRKPVMQVVVSDLSLRRASGRTFLDSLISVNDFR